MPNNEVVLKKIPLRVLLDILQDAWDKGANYIDIIGNPDETQDSIAIAIHKEYMTESFEDEFEIDVELEDEEDRDLTDDELNQLI
jgi:hypothetical protein